MASRTLALSAPDILAEYIRQSELKGFFEKRMAAPPDHMAMLIRNGQIIDAYRGAHFSVGGVANGLKSIIGGSTHISILLADLKPFSLQSPVKALSRDNVEIAGVATLELQINPEKPENVLGLINPAGRITREDVLERFRPHLTDRVFEAILGRVDAENIRGDKGLQDFIQSDIMREIERIAGRLGLTVNAVSMEWAINAAEREALQQAELDREQDTLDLQLERLKRDTERAADATQIQISAKVDLARLENASEDELAHMALQSEIEFHDARTEAERAIEMKALAHEIEVFKTERLARYRVDLDEASHVIDLTRQNDALRKIERGTEALDHEHLARMKKLGAFTDLEISERSQRMELAIAKLAQAQQLEQIKGLQSTEVARDDSDADRRIKEADAAAARDVARIKAEADARLAQLQAGAKMTPEQALAINAGLSADVAAVLVEQARAQASGNAQTMTVMQDMIDAATAAQVRSEDQAREMFRMGMDGAVGVAHGAGGKDAPVPASSAAAQSSSVECQKCGRENKAKARFCVGCGQKLRT